MRSCVSEFRDNNRNGASAIQRCPPRPSSSSSSLPRALSLFLRRYNYERVSAVIVELFRVIRRATLWAALPKACKIQYQSKPSRGSKGTGVISPFRMYTRPPKRQLSRSRPLCRDVRGDTELNISNVISSAKLREITSARQYNREA